MKNIILTLLSVLLPMGVMASPLDSLEAVLRDNPQIQEKIYVHMDNNCYFIGDTLWYKAYVVTADDFHPTNMSKLLYVELLTPDGFLVERQHVPVSGNGFTCGQFALEDSLYSGYYEVRAYTKWQLNFNVTEKYYNFTDERKFYSKQMCKDYFRDFEGLYSRVIPIYNKPKEAGNYNLRYMSHRPKQNVLKEHPRLNVAFYPEGGQCVKGVQGRVAFEITDHNGQCIDIEGKLSDGSVIKTEFNGRGTILYTPGDKPMKATFTWNNKEWDFKLPKATTGTTLQYDNEKKAITLKSSGVKPSAYAVLCRGKLISFNRINGDGQYSLPVAGNTGVNEVIVYDDNAQPLASRLFFINKHDYGKAVDVTMTAKKDLASEGVNVDNKTTLAPYSWVDLDVNAPLPQDAGELGTFSVSIRDSRTDDPAYDDGNIMTDMLLSSELKGFVASPAYYFEKDDAIHRHHLDLLMMVQGWRRYKRVDEIRYQPEKTTTFEGTVYKIPSTSDILELEDVSAMMKTQSTADKAMEEISQAMENAVSTVGGYSDNDSGSSSTDSESTDDSSTSVDTDTESETIEYADPDYVNGKSLKKQVLVEAEVEKDGQSAGAITRTDKHGHFQIQIPPYYDSAILFLRAYNVKDSVNKCMASRKDAGMADERQYPDYYVKRDMFFPIYSKKYSWYQINSPMIEFIDDDSDDDALIPENSKLAGNHNLQTVFVKGKRRGKRGIDRTKPAMVMDAYDLYNNATDYGLSYGVVDFRTLPFSASTYLVGNMGRGTQFNIRAMVEGASFYRNYTPEVGEFDKNMSTTDMFNHLHLNRVKDVRVYTDYELRTDSGDVMSVNSPDITLDFVPVPDDGKRYTYRDRRYVFPGISYPETYHSPNYVDAALCDPKDYRRTLYWNPNAKLNENGNFHTHFFNNSRETRVKVSVAGMDSEGQMYYSR